MAAVTAAITAVTVAITAPVVPASAGVVASPDDVSAAAGATLAAVPGSSLLPADPGSGCMVGPGAQTVVFRSDRMLVHTTERIDAFMASLIGHPAFVAAGLPAKPSIAANLSPQGATDVGATLVIDLGMNALDPVQVLTLVRGLRASGIEASPDYALSPSGGPIGMWPYGPPEPTAEPLPTPRRARTGRGVTVALYDTGVPVDRFGINAPANLLDGSDIDKLDRNRDGIADLPYDGHTLAVASVIATLAPGAEVLTARILDGASVATDSSAAASVITSYLSMFPSYLPGADPDIMLMPFGTPACDGLPPLGLQTVISKIVDTGRSLVIAAAGNRSTDRPFYPAAFDGVVAVGSLDLTADGDGSAWTSPTRAGPRSTFSNYGPWVDAWAGGEHLVTRHVTGLSFYVGGPELAGVADVSGTSYAAPAVAALVAEGVARTGLPATTVWRSLLRPAGTVCTASGGGVAVALTEMDDSFLERGEHRRRVVC